MKRRLTQFLFALGLLLTLAVSILVIRGLWLSDLFAIGIYRDTNPNLAVQHVILRSSSSTFSITWRNFAWADAGGWSGLRTDHTVDSAQPFTLLYRNSGDSLFKRLGFAYDSRRVRIGGVYQGVHREATVPSWFALLVCAGAMGLPMWILWRARRRHRQLLEQNRCTACGYDLYGAAHERCPECGAAVPAAAAVAV